MQYIQGTNRRQAVLFAQNLDQIVGPDNEVRLIDLFALLQKHLASIWRINFFSIEIMPLKKQLCKQLKTLPVVYNKRELLPLKCIGGF